jgi:hypothetical protein
MGNLRNLGKLLGVAAAAVGKFQVTIVHVEFPVAPTVSHFPHPQAVFAPHHREIGALVGSACNLLDPVRARRHTAAKLPLLTRVNTWSFDHLRPSANCPTGRRFRALQWCLATLGALRCL